MKCPRCQHESPPQRVSKPDIECPEGRHAIVTYREMDMRFWLEQAKNARRDGG